MLNNGIPAGFVELDPDDARKALEGHDDILAGEHKKAEALYRQHSDCPRGCGQTMHKTAAPLTFAFGNANWNIPRCLLKCSHCGCTFNPFDGMIVELGKPDVANAGGVLLDPGIK
jgi:hypothetical protein